MCARYCTISFNLAGPMTRDGPTEILVSATSQSCCDIPKFLVNFRQFSAAGDKKISILVTCLPNEFGTPWKSLWQPWHFSILEGPVMHDCQIEWNGTVVLWVPQCKMLRTSDWLGVRCIDPVHGPDLALNLENLPQATPGKTCALPSHTSFILLWSIRALTHGYGRCMVT